jgi:hypothetical protein
MTVSSVVREEARFQGIKTQLERSWSYRQRQFSLSLFFSVSLSPCDILKNEARVLCLLGKCSITLAVPQALWFVFCFRDRVLLTLPELMIPLLLPP